MSAKKMMMRESGYARLSIAAMLLKIVKVLQIGIIESSSKNYYQLA